jgi:hypothetical protein
MLASKPAGTSLSPRPGADPPCNLAAVTTRLMWACALATARVTVASTTRSLELWSHMLCTPSGRGTAAAPASSGDASPPSAIAAPVPKDETSAAAAPADRTPFASYRSSGGHAAAQVIVSD